MASTANTFSVVSAAPVGSTRVAVYSLAGIGGLVMRLVIEFTPSIIGLELLQLPLWLISGVFDLLAAVISTAFVAAASTVLYLDLRVRREGIDLDMAMSRAFTLRSTAGTDFRG